MKATDAALLELARAAGVRATVVFHLWHYRKATGGSFSIEGYCAFTDLPLEHGRRVLAVLPPERMRQISANPSSKSRLADDWTMPEEWIVMGRDKRFWTLDVCRTEAERFADWHRMKGSVFADWKAAWRNWIAGSHREDGKAVEQVQMTDAEKAAMYRRIGRNDLADKLERQS